MFDFASSSILSLQHILLWFVDYSTWKSPMMRTRYWGYTKIAAHNNFTNRWHTGSMILTLAASLLCCCSNMSSWTDGGRLYTGVTTRSNRLFSSLFRETKFFSKISPFCTRWKAGSGLLMAAVLIFPWLAISPKSLASSSPGNSRSLVNHPSSKPTALSQRRAKAWTSHPRIKKSQPCFQPGASKGSFPDVPGNRARASPNGARPEPAAESSAGWAQRPRLPSPTK